MGRPLAVRWRKWRWRRCKYHVPAVAELIRRLTSERCETVGTAHTKQQRNLRDPIIPAPRPPSCLGQLAGAVGAQVQARNVDRLRAEPLGRARTLRRQSSLGVANPAGKQHLTRGARTRGWLKRDLPSVRGPSSGCAWHLSFGA